MMEPEPKTVEAEAAEAARDAEEAALPAKTEGARPAKTEGTRPAKTEGARGGRMDVALSLASVLAPVALSLSVSQNGRDYAHDLALLRATGAAGTGSLRALDAVFYAPFTLVPLGTISFRLTLGSAFFGGCAAYLLFRLARRFYEELFGARWNCVYLALISALATVLGLPFVSEASAPAGATLGVCLALLPLARVALRSEPAEQAFDPSVALLLALAAFYEPLVGAGAGLAVFAFLQPWRAWGSRASGKKKVKTRIAKAATAGNAALLFYALAVALGVLPAVAAWLRVEGGALPRVTSLFAEPLGEEGLLGAARTAGASSADGLNAFYHAHLGLVAVGLLGAGLAIYVQSARKNGSPSRLGAALATLVLVAGGGLFLGAPAHGARFSAGVLAGYGGVWIFAGAALLAMVDFVSRADIPFAKASAAMIVVLELVLPVRQADESFTHLDARSALATPLLEVAAHGSLSPGTVIVTHEPQALVSLLAARESGELRSDVIVAPTFDLTSRLAREALAVEPLLAGVYRDVALGGRPEEFALSELSRARPLSIAFDPSWDRALARHLLAAGMATVFEAEPRGSSDRAAGIEAFVPLRQKLQLHLLPVGRDPKKLQVAIKSLRIRAIALGSGGEKAVLSKALDDLRALSRDDPIADELTRRIVLAKGPIDVRDLTP